MKERPILFSGPMVRAILEGRKTQTRRMVKPQPVWVGDPGVPFKTTDADPHGIIACPFGVPRDRLWVRETWQPFFEEDTGFCGVRYAAGGMPDEDKQASKYLDGKDRWRPSIHMPRWASRLTLEITAVRVERLQDITEEDAKAEGVAITEYYAMSRHPYRSAFIDLWDSIYGNWTANPYVWVVEFRKVEDKR